jgi:hypothetical protein
MGQRGQIGTVAGGLGSKGYCHIRIDRVLYKAHQLAWFYVTGEWTERIDHEDRDKSNNRFTNLRKATGSQNGANAGKRKNNRTGFPGVTVCANKTNPYRARLGVNWSREYIGDFPTAEAAYEAYKARKLEVFGEFACV